MKAVQISKKTDPRDLTLTDVPEPERKDGWVLIRVEAFGLNHSELVLMDGEIEADYIQKPVIPGIECVGIVEDAGGTAFRTGERVLALMGGMGRSFDGSWAEYTLVPADHVFHVHTDLPAEEIAAVGETYFTAWGSLREGLRVQQGQSLLIRGASCALGIAALRLAKAMGLSVTAVIRNPARREEMQRWGADNVLLNQGEALADGKTRWDRALELIGPRTLIDTLFSLRPGGICCSTGILGGISSLYFDPIRDIPNGVCLTGFFSNFPAQETVDALFRFLEQHQISVRPAAVWPLEEIAGAWEALLAGRTEGKTVITLM